MIEVVIALAIFVIGAIAVIRIFPPSFRAVQGSEMRDIGMRMGKSTLARLNNEPGLMPDAAYDTDPTTGTAAFGYWDSPYSAATTPPTAIAAVGSSSRNATIPNDIIPTAYLQSSLFHFKHIVGEKHTLQSAATYNGAVANTLYVLTQFPYRIGGGPYTVQAYREGKVNGVQISASGTLDFHNATLASDPGVAFHDADPNYPTRPPDDMRSDTPCLYYVSYRWIDTKSGSNQMQGVIDEPVSIPKDITLGVGTVIQVLHGDQKRNDPVIPGSVAVRFRYAVPTSVFHNNNLGLVAIGAANTTAELTDSLQTGDTVSVDYEVSDWRQLVQDDTPDRIPALTATATPAPAARQITVPARPVADDPSTPVYTLLGGTSFGAAATGQTALYEGAWAAGNITGSGLLDFDRKFGHATFDTSLVNTGTVGGPRARVVYQGLDNWTHQLVVAARSYVPFFDDINYTTLGVPREPWREYYWQGPAKSQLLYFHPSEAGKSVLVSYRYLDTSVTPSVVRDALSIVTINDLVAGPASTFDTLNSVSAELPDPNGKGNGLSATQVLSILSVQGIGVRARTAWVDNTRYQQVAVAGYRSADQL